MPVEDVAQLLRRWRGSGGVWSRTRVLAEGARLVAGLSPDERRTLARSLMDQGAPELARRLEDTTGHELEAGQVRAVADQLLSLDGQQVDRLVATLEDPQRRRQLAAGALAAVAEPTHQPVVPEEPVDDDGPDDDGPDQQLPDVGPPEVEPEPGEGRTAAPVRHDGAGAAAAFAPPLAARLRDAATARERLRALDADALAGAGAEAILEVIDAVPDGWQRRRAISRLVEGGVLDPVTAPEVVGRLGRASDRTFVAGAMLDAGVVTADQLADLLPSRAAARLAARRSD